MHRAGILLYNKKSPLKNDKFFIDFYSLKDEQKAMQSGP